MEYWEQWILRQIVSEGITKHPTEDELRNSIPSKYQIEMEHGLRRLMDKEIITQFYTGNVKSYGINIDKMEQARNIVKKKIQKEKLDVIQSDIEEPKGYKYWFEPEKRRTFRKQSIYRIFRKENEEREFIGQVLSQTMLHPHNIHIGSLDNKESPIAKLIEVMKDLTKNGDAFTLQDLQDIDRASVGNNRQRGKVILLICEKLGIIEFAGMKGNSASYRMSNNGN